MTTSLPILPVILILLLCSFSSVEAANDQPRAVTRQAKTLATGESVIETQIRIDATTSREELIHTCKFLASEGVELTFEELQIGKAVLGVVGRSRIKRVKGQIELSDGPKEAFRAGGAFSFNSLTITYIEDAKTGVLRFSTIAIRR